MRSSVPCNNCIDSFSLLDIQVVSLMREYCISLVCQVDFADRRKRNPECAAIDGGNMHEIVMPARPRDALPPAFPATAFPRLALPHASESASFPNALAERCVENILPRKNIACTDPAPSARRPPHRTV